MASVIILFAKAPAPGRVKTRLMPVLSAEQAAELHICFVEDVLAKLLVLKNLASVELHTDVLTEAWREFPVPRAVQCEGDLGQRMLYAIEQAFANGQEQALIVGADVPTVPIEYLQEILASPADVTLGPTEDGGYYAISVRRAHREMFQGVAWSSEVALEQTTQACQAQGLTVALGRPWYDIDGPADLVRLVTEPTPPRTTEWLKKHGFLTGVKHL
ncbi:MAG: TIGR04282 family arsenosugar biosynthesis glycosyltransferase [Bryobacter sp.]|nr:TIGR04282 family arsenosugar biosynthesis glycosyltransferase [Bryobacter sp.]